MQIIRNDIVETGNMLQDNGKLLRTYDVSKSSKKEEIDTISITVDDETVFFVVVITIRDKLHPQVWLENILSIVSNERVNASILPVHWRDMSLSAQCLYVQQMPSFHNDRDGKTHGSAWTVKIYTDYVMVSFPIRKVSSQTLAAPVNLLYREGDISPVWSTDAVLPNTEKNGEFALASRGISKQYKLVLNNCEGVVVKISLSLSDKRGNLGK